MAGLLDTNQFDNASFIDNLGSLFGGHMTAAKYLFKSPSDVLKHYAYPDYLSDQLKTNYPMLGDTRVDRKPLDVAINYGGGYQFGDIPNVTLEDADKMAKAYQLRGYMLDNILGNKSRSNDAWRDYQENMAGVKQSLLDKKQNIKFDHAKNMENAYSYALDKKKVK
jgi:hypothetical protein